MALHSLYTDNSACIYEYRYVYRQIELRSHAKLLVDLGDNQQSIEILDNIKSEVTKKSTYVKWG